MKKHLYFIALGALISLPISYAMEEPEQPKRTPEERAALRERARSAYFARKERINATAKLPSPEFLAEKRGQPISLGTLVTDQIIERIIDRHTFLDDDVVVGYVCDKDLKITDVTIQFTPRES